MKKSTAITWIALMAIIATVFGILFVSGSIRHAEQMEALKGDSVSQAARIMKLDADNAEKETQIWDLSAETEDQELRIEELNQTMPLSRRKAN